ncbi:hypothetical protein Ahy_B03g062062 [Arachis hypogaea]|uniref:Aminotransferase-like plant mobile domain-containing protein n=1 Tax=Arachis hypogaea TaxID=3818 RepID=A0A444ZT09_ARAHY|nr:hypothetical protein Ahy_B03g062062 [Arachis hypogaea]
MQPNRNWLVHKLDPPHTWNPMVENYLRATGFYHISRIGVIRGFLPLLAALVERWRTEIHTFVLPVGEVTVTLEDVAHIFGLPIDGELVSRWTDSSGDFLQSQSIAIFGREPSVSHSSKDAEPLDTEESIRRYIRCQIFCLLGSTLFTDKSTAYAHAKYLPLLRDFERIHTYSWGSACLAHLYRALCRASRYDTKEMDGPLNLLLVWVRERMPCIAPVPRQTLPPTEIPVARRWSHSERTTAWLSKTVGTFRHDIDYMQEFEWRSYDGLIVPDELHRHLEVCDIVAPLLSFECVEWHPADRVMRHLGYVQPPLRAARDIPLDQHCIILCGVQLHDWTVLHGPWIAEWANRRHSRLRDLHPLPTWDFLPMELVHRLLRTSAEIVGVLSSSSIVTCPSTTRTAWSTSACSIPEKKVPRISSLPFHQGKGDRHNVLVPILCNSDYKCTFCILHLAPPHSCYTVVVFLFGQLNQASSAP